MKASNQISTLSKPQINLRQKQNIKVHAIMLREDKLKPNSRNHTIQVNLIIKMIAAAQRLQNPKNARGRQTKKINVTNFEEYLRGLIKILLNSITQKSDSFTAVIRESKEQDDYSIRIY